MSSRSSRNILALPTEIQTDIFLNLDFCSLLSVSEVCTLWSDIAKSPPLKVTRYTDTLPFYMGETDSLPANGYPGKALAFKAHCNRIHRAFRRDRSSGDLAVVINIDTGKIEQWLYKTDSSIKDISDSSFLDDSILEKEPDTNSTVSKSSVFEYEGLHPTEFRTIYHTSGNNFQVDVGFVYDSEDGNSQESNGHWSFNLDQYDKYTRQESSTRQTPRIPTIRQFFEVLAKEMKYRYRTNRSHSRNMGEDLEYNYFSIEAAYWEDDNGRLPYNSYLYDIQDGVDYSFYGICHSQTEPNCPNNPQCERKLTLKISGRFRSSHYFRYLLFGNTLEFIKNSIATWIVALDIEMP